MKFVFMAMLLTLPACLPKNCSKPPEQAGLEPMDFSKNFTIASHFDQNNSTLKLTVSLDDGFHAYAQGEKIGRPIALEVSPKNGWVAAEKPQMPLGKKLNLGDLGHSVVLEDTFAITQKLAAGMGSGEATLFLQICTKTLCDRPRSHVVTWP